MDSESRIARLEYLANLLEKGVITGEEFSIEKAKLIGGDVSKPPMISAASTLENPVFLDSVTDPEPDLTPDTEPVPNTPFIAEEFSADEPNTRQSKNWLKIGLGFFFVILILGAVAGLLEEILIVFGMLLCGAGYMLHRSVSRNGSSELSRDLKAASLTVAGLALIVLPSIFGNQVTEPSSFSGSDSNEQILANAEAGSWAREVALKDLCDDELSRVEDGQGDYAIAMKGQYEGAEVSMGPNASEIVEVQRSSMVTDAQCPRRLIGSCTIKDGNIISKTELTQDGYYAC